MLQTLTHSGNILRMAILRSVILDQVLFNQTLLIFVVLQSFSRARPVGSL